MPEEIRLWQIEAGDKLRECTRMPLDLEARLEEWLDQDITVLAGDLMVIGRQVETDLGGFIDLICIDGAGDLVVVELKRDKTPRDVTAQTLEYAAWVGDLSSERITEVANSYLKERGPLEVAFKRRFQQELPESLNESHRMLIVASQIDPSSERIIRYLSENYGVSINAATFQYFKSGGTSEFLARVFLIEPSQVEYQSKTRRSSKRLPNLTYAELEGIADRNGVGELYRWFVPRLEAVFQKHTTRSSIGFAGNIDGSRKTVFNLIPGESNSHSGLRFQIYFSRFKQLFGISEEQALALLPGQRETWQPWGADNPEYSGFSGYFRDRAEAQRFLDGIVAR